jgi:hypothetical protein
MSTLLHMDLEAARRARSSIKSAWDEMDKALAAVMKAANNIRDQKEWMSRSYLEFNSVCSNFETSARSQVDQLSVLGQLLEKEISEWESAASKLG